MANELELYDDFVTNIAFGLYLSNKITGIDLFLIDDRWLLIAKSNDSFLVDEFVSSVLSDLNSYLNDESMHLFSLLKFCIVLDFKISILQASGIHFLLLKTNWQQIDSHIGIVKKAIKEQKYEYYIYDPNKNGFVRSDINI